MSRSLRNPVNGTVDAIGEAHDGKPKLNKGPKIEKAGVRKEEGREEWVGERKRKEGTGDYNIRVNKIHLFCVLCAKHAIYQQGFVITNGKYTTPRCCRTCSFTSY